MGLLTQVHNPADFMVSKNTAKYKIPVAISLATDELLDLMHQAIIEANIQPIGERNLRYPSQTWNSLIQLRLIN